MTLPEFLHEQDGEVRLVGHRIGLFHLLWSYNEGDSAEMLLERFPTLAMAQIHKVLGFYWENKAQVDASWAEARRRLEGQRAAGEHLDVNALRARLAARQGSGAAPVRTG